MSSSMETELLKSGAEGEHTTWKERDRAKWEQKREWCPWYTGSLKGRCAASMFECKRETCALNYWLGTKR
jgi:hypothetical protein